MISKFHSIRIKILLFLILASCAHSIAQILPSNNAAGLQPWTQNVTYWQYQGEPVLLLGGSKTDHLFLADNLLEHLDEIQAIGGNYLRNTMSQREGLDLKPYQLLSDGTFDLNKWNDDYWDRFEKMLNWTKERDIIVQIEVWDRFDYSKTFWEISPWNPRLNNNYTYEEVGFDEKYPQHPSRDKQPFFHTIPGMKLYTEKLDLIRAFQEAFVSKMLSYTLKYNHVLYCMNNETTTAPEWGRYWIDFIQKEAKRNGVQVYVTDMFDDAYLGEKATKSAVIFEDAEHYQFADISQVNSRNFGDDHWNELLYLLKKVNEKHPRPSNHTKIYGGGYKAFGTGGLEDGVERFWRNILAGSASSRFHRPDAGNGLNDRAIASIKAARLLERKIKLWDVSPHMELLSDREANEAYLAAVPGENYVLYFPYDGEVSLDLSGTENDFQIDWISITEGIWLPKGRGKLKGGEIISINAPYKGGWIAVITKAQDGK
ncbi:hypothetical protein [Portibacter lacus]|uniref:Collagen-binding domain-containing protein n=1 Tax=Portibacter lacus TaxID=1099794 RepID=A0AA37WFG3_9BACT|nr:hypothetical protein [Portibacter lacus]GLR16965.1 hypothetical protein GCM10007940_15800 [Portibacter lacus]